MRSNTKSLKSSSRDEIKGNARRAAGIIKEETGKALKSAGLVAEGTLDQLLGNIQKSIGRIKDKLGS